MTRLALFDLDGTLTRTNAVDDECYLEAMSTELGCALNPDWTPDRHCTDAGIAHEAFLLKRWSRSRPPSRLDRGFAVSLPARRFEPRR